MKKNKGFSLIELIIAIAILVILTGLLAPQFMKYIERARQAKGIQTLDSINNGLQVAFIDALIDSEDRKAPDNIVINRGTVANIMGEKGLDEILNTHLKSVINEEEIKKSFIHIIFERNGSDTGKLETYYMSGVTIQYYPNDDEPGSFYYFLDGVCANDPNRGNYGEYKNGKYIKWQ